MMAPSPQEAQTRLDTVCPRTQCGGARKGWSQTLLCLGPHCVGSPAFGGGRLRARPRCLTSGRDTRCLSASTPGLSAVRQLSTCAEVTWLCAEGVSGRLPSTSGHRWRNAPGPVLPGVNVRLRLCGSMEGLCRIAPCLPAMVAAPWHTLAGLSFSISLSLCLCLSLPHLLLLAPESLHKRYLRPCSCLSLCFQGNPN